MQPLGALNIPVCSIDLQTMLEPVGPTHATKPPRLLTLEAKHTGSPTLRRTNQYWAFLGFTQGRTSPWTTPRVETATVSPLWWGELGFLTRRWRGRRTRREWRKKIKRTPNICQQTVLFSLTTLETSPKWWTTISRKLSVNQTTEVSKPIVKSFSNYFCLFSDFVPLSARNLPPSFWDSSWVRTPSLPSSTDLYSSDPYSSDPWHNYMAAQMAVGGSYSAHQMYTARSYSSLLLQSRREWVEQNYSSSPYASMTGRQESFKKSISSAASC